MDRASSCCKILVLGDDATTADRPYTTDDQSHPHQRICTEINVESDDDRYSSVSSQEELGHLASESNPQLGTRILEIGGLTLFLLGACYSIYILAMHQSNQHCGKAGVGATMSTDRDVECEWYIAVAYAIKGIVGFTLAVTVFLYSLLRNNIARRCLTVGAIVTWLVLSTIGFSVWGAQESYNTDREWLTKLNPWKIVILNGCVMGALVLAAMIRLCKTFLPTRMGKWLTELSWEEAASSLQTGDVLFTSSTMAGSVCIKYWTRSNWAHCAVVVRNPSQKIKDAFYALDDAKSNGVYVLECSSAFHVEDYCEILKIARDPERIKAYQKGVPSGPFEEHRTWGGVQLTPLVPWLVMNREWGSELMVRRVYGGHIDNYRKDAEKSPHGFDNFMLQMQRLSYTESFVTRMLGVWNLNTNQGELRVQECFCSELTANLFIECGAFQNFNTNDSMPVHYAEDDGRFHYMFDPDTLLGSGTYLPWNTDEPENICTLGPKVRLLPPNQEEVSWPEGVAMP